MKKNLLATLLVAILASSMVFAGFSGSASVGFGANFDNSEYGFIDQSTNLKFNVDLATIPVESVKEGDVYASIKASLSVFVLNDQKDGTESIDTKEDGLLNKEVGLGVKAEITEAKVAGANWYVSIKGNMGKLDFAKSAIDTWEQEAEDKYGVAQPKEKKNATYEAPYYKAPGVEVGFAGYSFGVGFKAKAVKTPEFKPFDSYEYSLVAKTPEYDFDGIKVQAGAQYSAKKDSDHGLGVSASVGFVNDAISATVKSDIGYDIVKEEFGADVAANVVYDFLTVDAFYATEANTSKDDKVKNLLSAQVVTDLNSFDVPVKLTVAGKDLVNKQDLSAKAEFTIDAFTITPSVGYVIADKKFSTGADVAYKADAFTAKAGASVELTDFKGDTTQLKASASVESKALVPGATIAIAWSDAKDLLNNKADEAKNYGKVVASCKIEF